MYYYYNIYVVIYNIKQFISVVRYSRILYIKNTGRKAKDNTNISILLKKHYLLTVRYTKCTK